MNLLRCTSKIELFVSRFRLLAWSIPPPLILLPSMLWGIFLYHNIEIFHHFSGVFFDYCHPIFQLLGFLIESDCFSIDGLCPGVW